MTIDEAISHAREVAEEKRKSKSVNLAPEIISECELCAQEHDQLAEWLEELKQYRALEKRLSDMFWSSTSLKTVVDELERNLKEPDSPHPMKARILTYKESADWDAYRAIGTPEECRAAVEKQTAKKGGGVR